MEESGERIADEILMAIDKRTGKYVNLIRRTIYDDTPFPMVRYLNEVYDELDCDYIKHLDFNTDVDWEKRRYEIVKDLLSNDFKERTIYESRVDEAILVADLIIKKLKGI